MTGNTKILTGGVVVILLVAMIWFIVQPGKQKPEVSAPVIQEQGRPVLTSPPNLPTAPPIVPENIEGTVVSLTGTNLVINVSGTNKNYSLAKTQDFQKIVSGTREGGDMKTGPATIGEIKTGGKLYMIFDKTSNGVVSILLLD